MPPFRKRFIRGFMTGFVLSMALLLGWAISGGGYIGGSPISRVRSNFRSCAIALESYYIDNNAYPPADDGDRIPDALTTPVAYLRNHFEDQFQRNKAADSFVEYIQKKETPVGRGRMMALLLVTGVGAVMLTAGGFVFEWKLGRRSPLAAETGGMLAYFAVGFLIVTVNGYKERPYYQRMIDETNHRSLRYYYNTDGENGFIMQSPGPDYRRDLESLEKPSTLLFWAYQAAEDYVAPYTYDPTNGTGSRGDIFWVKQ